MDGVPSAGWRFLVPNSITFLVNLCALGAMGMAYYWHARTAAWLLLLAGVFDAIDGPVARRLNAQSRFGNIYDSMSDFLSFGVAPALSLVFLDLLHPAVALLYILAIQFRLTRYSAMPGDETHGAFFQGLSSPDAVYMGILLGLLPYSSFNWGFVLVSLLAVYPRPLWPKGIRIVKVLVAAAAMLAFIYTER